MNDKDKIVIIGVGYVGLPLAIEFAKIRNVYVYDPFIERINELNNSIDRNGEVDSSKLKEYQDNLYFSNTKDILQDGTIFIVTVPTPVNSDNIPDLSPLISASETVGSFLKKGCIVIYESTVFAGATEDNCVPVLEAKSGLKYKEDFHCGYSPE